MLKFFGKIVDKVQDSVLGYLEKYLDSDMHPALREAVEEQVQNFRSTVIDKVPSTVSRSLQEQDDSRITGMLAEALSGKVERLLELLLQYYKPEVDKATEKLADRITDQTMLKVKEFLHVSEAAPEPGTRDIVLPGMGKIDITQTVGSLLGVDKRMPNLEKDLRDNFQPIGQMLNSQLWDKFVEVLNAVLKELFPWLDVPVSRDLVMNEQRDRGWFSDTLDDIQDALKSKVTEHLPDFYDILKEPVGEIIADMVKWLEDHSVQTTCEKVRGVVKDLDLVNMQ